MLVPAARAKNAFGILFSPPNRKNAARSLVVRSLLPAAKLPAWLLSSRWRIKHRHRNEQNWLDKEGAKLH